MFTAHFFKVLGTFLCMIILGLLGLFAIDYFRGTAKMVTEVPVPAPATAKQVSPLSAGKMKTGTKSADCKIKKTC